MTPYKNLAGNSGIRAYEVLSEGIRIRFNNDATYLYDFHTPGREHVEHMKRLAIAGSGLATYIAQHVGACYADKII